MSGGRVCKPLIDHISFMIRRDTGVTAEGLQSAYRGRTVAQSRQVGMWLLRNVGGRSFPETGRAFGGRDHTTAMHGCSAVEARAKADDTYAQWLGGLQIELEAFCAFVPVDDVRGSVAPESTNHESLHTD